MKKITYFLILLLILINSTSYAEKPRLAILDFNTKGVSRKDALLASEWLRTAIIDTNSFYVIERNAINKILKEQRLSATGIIDTKTAIKLGKMVSAQKILVSSISSFYGKIVINGRVIDTETGIAEFAHKESTDNIKNIDKAINAFAEKLAQKISDNYVKKETQEDALMPNDKSSLNELYFFYTKVNPQVKWKQKFKKRTFSKNSDPHIVKRYDYITAKQGVKVVLKVDGELKTNPENNAPGIPDSAQVKMVTPSGEKNKHNCKPPFPQFSPGVLIMKTGNGQPFQVRNNMEYTIQTSGKVYYMINLCSTDRNMYNGFYSFRILVPIK